LQPEATHVPFDAVYPLLHCVHPCVVEQYPDLQFALQVAQAVFPVPLAYLPDPQDAQDVLPVPVA